MPRNLLMIVCTVQVIRGLLLSLFFVPSPCFSQTAEVDTMFYQKLHEMAIDNGLYIYINISYSGVIFTNPQFFCTLLRLQFAACYFRHKIVVGVTVVVVVALNLVACVQQLSRNGYFWKPGITDASVHHASSQKERTMRRRKLNVSVRMMIAASHHPLLILR
jgi:hypothetical protein